MLKQAQDREDELLQRALVAEGELAVAREQLEHERELLRDLQDAAAEAEAYAQRQVRRVGRRGALPGVCGGAKAGRLPGSRRWASWPGGFGWLCPSCPLTLAWPWSLPSGIAVQRGA